MIQHSCSARVQCPMSAFGSQASVVQIARIYKALKHFADLQGPICNKDSENKGINLIVHWM